MAKNKTAAPAKRLAILDNRQAAMTFDMLAVIDCSASTDGDDEIGIQFGDRDHSISVTLTVEQARALAGCLNGLADCNTEGALLRLSRTYLPYTNYFLAQTAHSRLFCCILPRSGIFLIPYRHGCLTDVSSLRVEADCWRGFCLPRRSPLGTGHGPKTED